MPAPSNRICEFLYMGRGINSIYNMGLMVISSMWLNESRCAVYLVVIDIDIKIVTNNVQTISFSLSRDNWLIGCHPIQVPTSSVCAVRIWRHRVLTNYSRSTCCRFSWKNGKKEKRQPNNCVLISLYEFWATFITVTKETGREFLWKYLNTSKYVYAGIEINIEISIECYLIWTQMPLRQIKNNRP